MAIHPTVSVLRYPGGIFFEIAAALEPRAPSCDIRYYTPRGTTREASNRARTGSYGSERRPTSAMRPRR